MYKRRTRKAALPAFLAALALVSAGCAAVNSSKALVPVKEYERLIAGRLDADYVGDQECLTRCHAHDKYKQYFDASTMGAQLSPESGLPLVNCESCHGPGSLAVRNIRVINGVETCDFETFIDLGNLPKGAQNLICNKCHSANATFSLHNWNAGTHNLSGVSCFDCHNVHQGADLKVHPRDVAALCYKCHPYVKAEFALPTRHPVQEGRVTCLDCHDPHGSTYEKQLREATVKETCAACHADKEGPFAFEHADVTDDCRNCHTAHGSVNNGLLTLRMPMLCLQCHEGHGIGSSVPGPINMSIEKPTYFTRCTDCHSEIHGSDTPGNNLPGSFMR
ncbi:MAG TPA: DmsE family decaheme c-type cytochrome [Nitrospirota bacterium]|nr:DmsE family decaheme c-type cytochrome [Nitrospirota bacterium]